MVIRVFEWKSHRGADEACTSIRLFLLYYTTSFWLYEGPVRHRVPNLERGGMEWLNEVVQMDPATKKVYFMPMDLLTKMFDHEVVEELVAIAKEASGEEDAGTGPSGLINILRKAFQLW